MELRRHSTDPIRVVLVDDSPLVRQYVRSMLAPVPDVEVVGEAEDSAGALDVIREQQPEVVVLDIEMPGSGIGVLRVIKEELPATRVIMLTNYADAFFRRICLAAGASFFLDKSLEFDRVPEVVRRIAMS